MNSTKHHPSLELTTAVPPPSAMARMDAYDVLERLAVGPGAIVYRARQARTGREVIFKLLLPDEVSNPLDVGMVMALKPKLAGLRHPHIAEWIDAYVDPEGAVLIYDYMPGMAGQHVPSKRPLNKADSLTVARQLCQALQAGEQVSLPHGDIKPSNLIVADRDREGIFIQVQDWGLADCRPDASQESLLFMAPERLAGGSASVSSDLFSVGATLCYLLTGCVPVQGGTRDELLQSWPEFSPDSICTMRADLDDHFCKWLGWLLRMNPADRPATMAKALEVLWQVVAYASAQKPKPAPEQPAAAPVSTTAPTQKLVSAAPVVARPTAPKPTAAKLHLPASPLGPTALKAASSLGRVSAKQPPAPVDAVPSAWPKRLVVTLSLLTIITAIICFSLWMTWGPGWTDELSRRWTEWK